jgi:3-oxoacyl-[acyl-carrier protein] reductase
MLDNAKHRAGNAAEISEGLKQVALGREGEPEEVSKLVCFLLSDGASYISGTSIVIDGGLHC